MGTFALVPLAAGAHLGFSVGLATREVLCQLLALT